MEGARLARRPNQALRGPLSENAVTLRLASCCGEWPLLSFGAAGPVKEALLLLVNDRDSDNVLTLEKLPPGISLTDEAGSSLGPASLQSVPCRSSRLLHVSWRPDTTPATLDGSLRWRTPEGLQLQVRVIGGVSEPQGSARGTCMAGPAVVKTVASKRNTSLKAPARTLSLGRPPQGTPAVARSQTPLRTLQEVQRRPGVLEPAPINAPAPAVAGAKLPVTPPPGMSPLGARLACIKPTVSPPPRVCSTTATFNALDFRRVGCVESKRERGLISWMNSEVSPLGTAASDAISSSVEGHVARRLLGEVTGKAYVHFKRDAEFAAMASKIESKIAARQLTIRDAEHTLSDIRMRQQALDVLTSYHPFWLAVGLQTVLGRALVFSQGQMLTIMRPGAEAPAFIRSHILDNFLGDLELASQFRHTAFKQEYWEALGARVLGRMLLLVLLLDRMAQRCDLPPGTPSLFRHEANIKSSEQVVQELLQPRLAGAGDVLYSLRMMAYNIEYVQHARDEADFRVRKPLDLRDGTRLAKLLDNLRRQAAAHPVLTPPPSCSSASFAGLGTTRLGGISGPPCQGRVPSSDTDLLPTMAFPQNTGKPMDESQMRNNCLRLVRALQQQGIALQALAQGVGVSVAPRDPSGTDNWLVKFVAEGLLRVDQKVTLGMLWQIAIHYKLKRHVDARSLEREAARLRRATAAAAAAAGEACPSATIPGAADDAAMRYFNDPTSQALLLWMRAACAPYGIDIKDFTWSLSDGRALCYLIHTYMSDALPRNSIVSLELPSSSDEMARLTGGTEYVKLETLRAHGWTAVYEMGGTIHDEALAAAYKHGVDANFAAAHAAGENLGVPAMLSSDDYLNDGPDELAAILYVALLGEALLKLTAERRAGYVIMEFLRRRLCWRPSYMHASLERFKVVMRRNDAALTVQAFWRMRRQRLQYLAIRSAAAVLQGFSRRWLVCRRLQRQMHAATVIQAAWRGLAVRQQLWRERHAATVIQASWRGLVARRALSCYRNSVATIQKHFKRYLASNRRSQERLAILQFNAAVSIQAAWRGFRARRRVRQLLKERAQVVCIQAHIRGYLARHEASTRLGAIGCIQAAWRAARARRLAETRRIELQNALENRAATVLQAVVRGHLLRQRLAARSGAAVLIQSSWRSFSARKRYLALQGAAVTIQAAVRSWLVQRSLRGQQRAATVIQSLWRRRLAMLAVVAARNAAATIQAAWRAWRQRRCYLAICQAVVQLQAAWRAHAARRKFLRLRSAAVLLQAAWRGRAARKAFADMQLQHRAATAIQSAWRAYFARRAYVQVWRAALLLQSSFRCVKARQAFLHTRQAAITIQTAWWAYRKRRAAVEIQAYYRMVAARRRFIHIRQATLTLQAHGRRLLTTRRLERTRTAALVFQGVWRCVLAHREMSRRAEAFYRDLRRQQEERLLEIARHFMLRSAAAKRIQAWWRGHLARRAVIPFLLERREQACQLRAAIAIQTAWRGYIARISYRKVCRALETIRSTLVPIFRAKRQLELLRRTFQARIEASTVIQAAVRMWLARRRLLRAVSAAIQIQAAWRGHVVRRRAGRAKQEARQRLQQATAKARLAPHCHIGNKTREALEMLLRPNKNLAQVLTAVEVMEVSTRYSRDCCKLIAQHGGVAALLRIIRLCNRSKPYVDVLNRGLAVLQNICRYETLVPDVFRAEECLTILSERLQYFREAEEVFVPTVTLLQRLLDPEELAAEVPTTVLRHWEGIHQVLARKAENERKYLERLEGQKGSDVSARESARKLFFVQQQVQALELLINRACVVIRDDGAPASDVGAIKAGATAGTMMQSIHQIPGLKNTLVKDVVQRMAGAVSTAPNPKKRTAGATTGSPLQAGKGGRPFSMREDS